MKYLLGLALCACTFLCSFSLFNELKERYTDYGHKVVVCIPVYGQSLALADEAKRYTNFDSLRIKYNGRIISELFDYGFGFIDENIVLQHFKKLVNYNRRSYELSLYSMAEKLATELGEDTLICIFPGGRWQSSIDTIRKGTPVYQKFLFELNTAYKKAQKRGWEFFVPAICWMQGESDIVDYPGNDYKKMLKQFQLDINSDIRAITKQDNDIALICYQPNVLSQAEHFNPHDYECRETEAPQSIVELIQTDSLFWASGPTYPYTVVNERLHIDGAAQRHIGGLEALAALNILRNGDKIYGIIPKQYIVENNNITIQFYVPKPPLTFDTTTVSPVENYGFSVITKDGKDILSNVSIENNAVRLSCLKSPTGCKIRYAVNGNKYKSGHIHGPRGNLRDSQGDYQKVYIEKQKSPLHNWCYQFDIACIQK